MRVAILIGSVMLVCLMLLFPPVRYAQGGSMETPGYKLNLATVSAELIISAMTVASSLTFRSRR
jgi:hypothetical protein